MIKQSYRWSLDDYSNVTFDPSCVEEARQALGPSALHQAESAAQRNLQSDFQRSFQTSATLRKDYRRH